jgi:hypothetical protein
VLQSRAAADGASASADGPEAKPPHWLKLVRTGNVFDGYVSADGTNWLAAGSVTNALNKNLSAGLALTAHNNAVLNSTLFENVTVTGAGSGKAEKR